MDDLEVPMVSGNIYHVASEEAISDFWKLGINFAEGGGLIVLEKEQVKWEGDEQYHFVALFEGGGENWKRIWEINMIAKRGEIIPGTKKN